MHELSFGRSILDVFLCAVAPPAVKRDPTPCTHHNYTYLPKTDLNQEAGHKRQKNIALALRSSLPIPPPPLNFLFPACFQVFWECIVSSVRVLCNVLGLLRTPYWCTQYIVHVGGM